MPSITTAKPQQGGVSSVLPAGDYSFEVLDATEKTAKGSGNVMIELKMQLEGAGGSGKVWDLLVFTPKAAWKINQYLKSVGAHPGEGQEINVEADDCIGQRGTLKLKVGKNDKGEPRNEVEAYTWEDTEF